MSRRPGYDLEQALRRLHLPTIRRLYTQLAEEAEKDGWTFREYLEHLISEEIAHRAETRITRSTRKAKFPFLKTIDEFDFSFQQSVKKTALGRFFGPEFVEDGRSVILLGKPGRGKTHLAIAMAYKAIQNGYEAFFTTAAALPHFRIMRQKTDVLHAERIQHGTAAMNHVRRQHDKDAMCE